MEGTPFGRYRLIELLGRGGMGEVWRAHDTVIDRIVAVKVLPAHLADDEAFVQRFRREAHAAARLNNPHVIPIHNSGEIDGRLYVDMRLIEGRDLQEVLADGPMVPGRAVRIIEQVAKALHAAHKIGLVHRDVKPSNILLDEDDFAYLIDFGIARGADQTRMTSTGGVIGSFHYMAPERFSAQEADARADVYALACVLYECLTGHTPYPGDSLEQQYAGHVATPPPQPSSTDPDLPATFDPVIATGMAKDPDQRYATTVELASAAHDAITVPIPQPAPSPAPNSAPTEHAPNPVTSQPRAVEEESSAAPTRQRPQRAVPPDPGVAATEHAHRSNQPQTQVAPTLPPQPAAPPTTGVRGLSGRTKITLIAAAVVVLVATAVGIPAIFRQHTSPTSPPAPPVQTPAYGPPTPLPFTGLSDPAGVAVDTAGSVYVTDFSNSRVLKLAVASSTPTVLPFSGLDGPVGVAVDAAGNVFVTDRGNQRVVGLNAGSSTQMVLSFTGLDAPEGVAVDSAGAPIYVTDTRGNKVVTLAAGSSTPTVLPFTGLGAPMGVAVDTAGNVYVLDNRNSRVVKLAVASGTQTVLPFTGLEYPRGGPAVDTAGDVFVLNNSKVVKLAAGSNVQTVLPLTGLNGAEGIAVDTAGNVYVADGNNNRVLKLPVQ